MEGDSKKLEHLKMIQETIVRMSGYGFQLKNWGVVIVSALLAFSATGDNHNIAWLTLVPLLTFWVLDGVFLQLERHYRALFDTVRESADDFNYNLKLMPEHTAKDSLQDTCFSKTLRIFWGGLAGLTFLLVLWLTKG